MITETRERFLRAIAEQIDPARIVEAYIFPSIRQGQMETGVAVIAATQLPVDTLADPLAPELPMALDPEAAVRTEVLTASYRWTRKGPERGKWEVEVIAEADAPLVTVARVVRGVQERAGEALDAHRMDGDEVRALVPVLVAAAPVDTPTEPAPPVG